MTAVTACLEAVRTLSLPARKNPGSDLLERPACASEGRFRGGRSRPTHFLNKFTRPPRPKR